MGLNFPNAPTLGQLHPIPPLANVPVYQWDGEKWVIIASGVSPVYIGDFPPLNPSNGTLWFNSSNAQLYIYYTDVNSSQWVMIVSAQAPAKLQKNYIINGAMMISQENGGAGSAAANYYPVDQFVVTYSYAGNVTTHQYANPTPSGSPYRIRIIINTADTSVAASDYFILYQAIEGQRIADMRFGSPAAKTFTLQFGVKAPAGTYCVTFANAAVNRSYVAEYTISAGEANNDVVKSITVAGDITGTWVTDNTQGLNVYWCLMAGTTFQKTADAWGAGNVFGSANQFNCMGQTASPFELFDVSLTEGTVAPPFTVPDYASELQACQRYFETWPLSLGAYTPIGTGIAASTTTAYVNVMFKTKRAAPTLVISSPNDFMVWGGGAAGYGVTALSISAIDLASATLSVTSGSMIANQATALLRNASQPSKLAFSARL
jgi:hypothetical protein